MQTILISINPEWCKLIASGKKTIEVRKTCPKISPLFRCVIYCTKEFKPNFKYSYKTWAGRGKVIGEFVCDRIERFNPDNEDYSIYDIDDDLLTQTCLTHDDLSKYGNGKPLYGWHISKLKIYDKPKELSEFCFPPELYCEKGRCGGCPYDQVPNEYGEYSFDCEWKRPIKRPPQSWYYVEEIKNDV